MTGKGFKGDAILIGISILGILILSFLLYDDSIIFRNNLKSKAKVLGKITTGNSDVRRKYMDNFAWLPIEDLAEVFLGDSIFTGDNSKALINLIGGANISIEPQSLIVLSMNEENLILDLQFGSMDAELLSEKSNINLKMGDEEVILKGDVKPSTVSYQKKKGDVLSELKVKKGKIKMQKGKSNDAVVVAESFKVVVDPELPKLKVKSVIGFKEERIAKTKVWVEPAAPVKLSWQHDGAVVGYEVEAAEDKDFKKILVSQYTEKELLDWLPNKKIDKFYWRVKAFNPREKQISISEARETEVKELSSPKIIAPKAGQTFTVLRDKNDKLMAVPPVETLLDDTLVESKYLVEVSLDEKFEKVEKSLENKVKSFEIRDLSAGSFYMRAKSKSGNGSGNRPDSPWSSIVKFVIEEQESQRILAPTLVKRDIETILKQVDGKFLWPTVEWQSVRKAEKYVIEVSMDSSFKTNIFLKTITETAIEIPNLKEGKYYFRVRGVTATIFGDWSENGTINVVQLPPGILPISDIVINIKDWKAPIPAQTVNLKWDNVAGARHYLLEVANSEDFKTKIVTKTVDKNNYLLTITKDQTYFARVTPLDTQSKKITVASLAQKFDFIVKRPLKPPTLMQPKNKMSYILYKMDIPHIWIEWSADEKASLHIIEFSKDAEFTKVKKTMEIKKTDMILDKNMLKGKIFWRVRSINEKINLKSEWSEPQVFFVVGLENEDD
jgi:hypothetical protein